MRQVGGFVGPWCWTCLAWRRVAVSFSCLFWVFGCGAPARRGVTFFLGKKESHQRKLPWGRERVRAERSDGPSLRWPLGSLIGGQSPMPVTGWFYRSFANSFTLCLIWLACAARVAVSCAIFLFPYLSGARLWLSGCGTHDCPFHRSLSAPGLP